MSYHTSRAQSRPLSSLELPSLPPSYHSSRSSTRAPSRGNIPQHHKSELPRESARSVNLGGAGMLTPSRPRNGTDFDDYNFSPAHSTRNRAGTDWEAHNNRKFSFDPGPHEYNNFDPGPPVAKLDNFSKDNYHRRGVSMYDRLPYTNEDRESRYHEHPPPNYDEYLLDSSFRPTNYDNCLTTRSDPAHARKPSPNFRWSNPQSANRQRFDDQKTNDPDNAIFDKLQKKRIQLDDERKLRASLESSIAGKEQKYRRLLNALGEEKKRRRAMENDLKSRQTADDEINGIRSKLVSARQEISRL